MEPTNVIIRPIVTEKSTWAAGRHNAYTFEVADDASKHMIGRAVATIYNVKVADVRTVVRKGKAKRTRFGAVKKKDRKRAIVTLSAESKSIDIFGGPAA